MYLEHFNMRKHGFAGHMAAPDEDCKKAVIVIMGGEQSMLPGRMIAERFADYGITGLAVSLFGADGLPDVPDQVPLEMFRDAVTLLKTRGYTHISAYGQSMGSIFAVLTACYVGDIEKIIMVSPTHVPFEGTDKKSMSGHSVATWAGRDIPFVHADFSKIKASKYYRHPAADHKVMGMWIAYHDAYANHQEEEKAFLPIEKTNADILMIAGSGDEAWPAEYSVRRLEAYLKEKQYKRKVKMIIYPNVSHLTGMMPNREREKKLYRILPLVGIMYKTFGKYKTACMQAFEQSEKEIISWLQ